MIAKAIIYMSSTHPKKRHTQIVERL